MDGRTTVATFFDIKRAFDTVWHAKLLDKMQALGITGRLYKFVQTFLDSRRMAVLETRSQSLTLWTLEFLRVVWSSPHFSASCFMTYRGLIDLVLAYPCMLMTLPFWQIAQPTRTSDATRCNDFDSP